MTKPKNFRAPFHLKYSIKSCFEPEFVYIGPYNYDSMKLDDDQYMENVKGSCTSYFLKKLPSNSTAEPDINDLVKVIDPYGMETEIRDWYGGSTQDIPQDELFRILVRDSCFIIRIILAISRPVHENMFFRLGVDIKKVRIDMLLLENQIPFFFLLKVYDFFSTNNMLPDQMRTLNLAQARKKIQPMPETRSFCPCCPAIFSAKKKSPQPTDQNLSVQQPNPKPKQRGSDILADFLEELEPFICLDMPWQFNSEYGQNEEPDHLLHLYWKCCLPFQWKEEPVIPEGSNKCNECGSTVPFSSVPETWINIHLRSNSYKRIKNAYELYWRAGVSFQKLEHENGFGVTFQKGILKLPHLQLDHSHIKLLTNLIALEESKPSKYRVMTSYVLLLDGLINTDKDVELLQRYGVITNKMGSSQIASSYFNDIGNACSIDYNAHYCQEQFASLNQYYHSGWAHQWAKLRHTHFHSPWAVISLLAGSTLLIFSAVQTFYGVSRYYHHR